MSRSCLFLIGLCLFLVVQLGCSNASNELEGFDEVEEDSIAQPIQVEQASQQSHVPLKQAEAAVSEADAAIAETPAEQKISANATAATQAPYSLFVKKEPKDFIPEIIGSLLLVAFAINVYFGRKENESIAVAWATAFCSTGGIFDRNFSLLGPGDTPNGEVLLRESNSCFKFHASGRRFCTRLVALLQLRKRQDLLWSAFYLVNRQDDYIELEYHMEGAMPPMVLFVGTSKYAKTVGKQEQDLIDFTKRVEVPRDRIANWPSDRLTVLAEHSSLFYDIMTDSMLSQVFSRTAFEGVRKYFRFLHFTTEDPASSHPRVLRFSFTIPPPEKMEELQKLIAASCAFVDIIGSYAAAFPPELKKKADIKRQEIEARRAKARADEEHVDPAAERRAKKALEEQERVRKMTPQQRQKYEEKKKAIMQKRSMRVKMVK